MTAVSSSIAGGMDDDAFVSIDARPKQPSMPIVFDLPKLCGHDLFEASVDEIQHLFALKAFTSEDYTRFCLARVQRVNPYLEAVIETNPDALAIARERDSERDNGKMRSALHGIPVLVKDNMATADRMQTTAGSFALLGSIVPKDAHVVQMLRDAGAVILGKSNLDEWAGMRASKHYSAGYSARGGQCRCPFDLTKSPSGSSSGSAVAVSANIVPLAFGTETDTSIIGPALTNGVVGIKPTVGLTSRGGVIPISETQDSVGSYGRTVADATLGLDAIVGRDNDDKYTAQPGRRQEKKYAAFLSHRHALKGAKFGLPMKRFWDCAPETHRKVTQRVLDWIKEAGADIIPVDMPCAEERIHRDGHWDWMRYGDSRPEISEITVSKVETYDLMAKYLQQLENTPMKSLEDIVAYNDANRGTEGGHAGDLPAFADGQDLFRQCIETQGHKGKIYRAALGHIQTQCRDNGIDAALRHVDPDTEQVRVLDGLLFCDTKMAGQCIAAQAGYPIIALPVGLDPYGMPVGLTVQQSAWQEGKLVKWASAIEDLCWWKQGSRATPTYRNHLRKNVPAEYAWTYAGAPDSLV